MIKFSRLGEYYTFDILVRGNSNLIEPDWLSNFKGDSLKKCFGGSTSADWASSFNNESYIQREAAWSLLTQVERYFKANDCLIDSVSDLIGQGVNTFTITMKIDIWAETKELAEEKFASLKEDFAEVSTTYEWEEISKDFLYTIKNLLAFDTKILWPLWKYDTYLFNTLGLYLEDLEKGLYGLDTSTSESFIDSLNNLTGQLKEPVVFEVTANIE